MTDQLNPVDLSTAVETGTGALRLDLTRRLAAEALGTGFLVMAVIGSGIAASRLSSGDVGLQLLENAAATTGALIGLILMFAAVSGAHFNPVVSLLDRALGSTTTRDTGLYAAAQIVGGCLGAMLANVMFEIPAIDISTKDRSSPAAVAVRGRRHCHPAVGHPGLCTHRPCRRGALRSRGVDRGRLLVHLLDQLRQPGRDDCPHPGGARMMKWRKLLFVFLARNARPATQFFGIPPNQVVELGMQVEF